MYNERKENFSIRDVTLQVLFVILFIFILLWIFPSKGYVKDAVEPLYANNENASNESAFNENITNMREAAKSYFTNARLPKEVGNEVSITLGEMLDKKLLLPFVNSEGRQCDTGNSYVEVTKMDEEYTMKINLKCPDNEDYIIEHMGCYDYCEKDICEKEDETKQTSNDDDDKPTPTPNKPVSYLYEYVKVVGDSYTNWSGWSNWSTRKVYENSLRDVVTKTETEYDTEKRLVAYKTTTYKEPIYEDQKVQIGTHTQKECGGYTTQDGYTTWQYQGKEVFYSTPSDTPVKKYEYVAGSSGDYDCGDCASSTYATYEVYTRSAYKQQVCAYYKTTETPIYETREVFVGYDYKTKKEPFYGYVKVPETEKYYKYRTRELVKGTKTTKWSYYNNKNLINSGYEYTGKKIVNK